jgi:TusA-related sulfurtransferase
MNLRDTLHLDLRGLEPPEPMIRILETLAATPPGGSIEAHTDRRPMFLLEELKRRGCPHLCEPNEQGGWKTRIEIVNADHDADHTE